MKLLLTSSGMQVKDEILKFLPKPYNQTNIAYITTASVPEPDTSYSDKEKYLLKDLGCNVEEMTFEGKNESEVSDLLYDKDVIYVQGGNTFYLLKILKESGADKVISKLVKQGVLYIGVSAGSYIACPTIEMAFWGNQDENDCGLSDFSALGFVPFLLVVHYNSEPKEMIQDEIKNSNYKVKILTDKQALLVDNDKVQFVGSGDEYK